MRRSRRMPRSSSAMRRSRRMPRSSSAMRRSSHTPRRSRIRKRWKRPGSARSRRGSAGTSWRSSRRRGTSPSSRRSRSAAAGTARADGRRISEKKNHRISGGFFMCGERRCGSARVHQGRGAHNHGRTAGRAQPVSTFPSAGAYRPCGPSPSRTRARAAGGSWRSCCR